MSAPAPARAGSAGVFITLAADMAVMAPHTRYRRGASGRIGSSGEVEETTDDRDEKEN